MSKRTKQEIKEVIQEWEPSIDEKRAFKTFLDSYMEDKEASEINWGGKVIKIKAHRGYKNNKETFYQAIADFGGASYKEGVFAIKIDAYFNDFIQTGSLNLYEKFLILEKWYFKVLYAKQKEEEHYQQLANQYHE